VPVLKKKKIISGLVVRKENTLKAYNLIYQSVFNQQWLGHKLADLRPYYAQFLAWKNSEFQEKAYLLQGSELQRALTWSSGQILDEIEQKFLSASQHWNQRQKNQKIIKFSSFGVLAGFATFSLLTLGNNWFKNYNVQYCSVLEKVGDTCFRDVLSSGESKFFLSRRNYYLDKGIVEFNKKNYFTAKDLFEKAINAAPKDPVSQIFYNNAQARIQGQKSGEISYKFAAVIPADSNESIAIEILRGIADSQTKFNQKGGKNHRLLEIVLANDGDEPEVAPRVARTITSDKGILAVIGHYSSDTTGQSLPEYDRASLAIVSPTSVSSKLEKVREKGLHKVFFRTVPNNRQIKILAEHIKEKMKLDTVVVFHEEGSKFFSKSGRQHFIEAYEKLKKQVKAVVVIPSVKTVSIAISLAKENNQQLPFFGVGATLYNPDIIEQGGELLEGLTLEVPFFNQNSTYSKESEKRWRGKITYRTAGAYDATQALIKALEQAEQPTRGAILEKLRNIELSADEASGQPVKFDRDGNIIDRKYVIVPFNKL